MQAGEWPKKDFMGVEVTGKTVSLIGAGNIGSIVASERKVEDEVMAYDPFLTEERAIELGIEKVDQILFTTCRFRSLHLLLNGPGTF